MSSVDPSQAIGSALPVETEPTLQFFAAQVVRTHHFQRVDDALIDAVDQPELGLPCPSADRRKEIGARGTRTTGHDRSSSTERIANEAVTPAHHPQLKLRPVARNPMKTISDTTA
jgi:hypothetical protein